MLRRHLDRKSTNQTLFPGKSTTLSRTLKSDSDLRKWNGTESNFVSHHYEKAPDFEPFELTIKIYVVLIDRLKIGQTDFKLNLTFH